VFALEDLFVVGVGFDVAGAWLLARGLLAGPAEIALRTASLWGGNPATTASQLEDRLNGTLGVASLILGFSLQAVAYGIVVGHDDLSGGNWIGVAISAVAPIAALLLFDRITRPRRLRRLIVDIARYDVSERRMRDRPKAKTIVELATACGYPEPSVGDQEYARDHFGVERFAPDRPR
jgi:hypothetical protein